MGVNRGGDRVERQWYPSGPRLDGKSSASENYTPQPANPNPNPDNYKIIQADQVGKYLIIKIRYPDCTNYEGVKILVFKDITPIDLLNQKKIDPHFFKHGSIASPIARFVPTDEGWTMAVKFCNAMGG